MQTNHGESAFGGIGDISIERVLPGGAQRRRTISQDLLDGIVTGATIKLHVADLRNLTEAEIGILRLQIYDELAHRHRQRAMMILSLLLRWAEQARHPQFLECIRRSPQRAFG